MSQLYYVCKQNCIEDWYCEDVVSRPYASFSAALDAVNKELSCPPANVFDAKQELRWYFPSCEANGILSNPSPAIDVLDCYQIINIIPAESYVSIDTNFCSDPRAVYSIIREYSINYTNEIIDYSNKP